jgi:nucleoside-diphosphate-sugar epimerase
MARILVTGSSGFLGSALCERLHRQGFSVDGLDIAEGPYTNIRTDVKNLNETYDVIFHFAAYVGGREGIENNYLDVAKNIELDRDIFGFVQRNNIARFIYPSSSAVYPVVNQGIDNIALSEYMIDFDTNTIGVSDHLYGWSKLTAERMLWEINKHCDTKISVVRPFSGYGPTQSTDYPVPNLIDIVKNRPDNLEVWGTGLQTRDFVYIDDVVDTLVWCMTDDVKYRTINIGTGIATSFVDLITVAHRAIHGTDPAHIKTLTHKPVGVLNRYCDPRLQQQLGIYPKTTLEEGIKKFL